MLETNVKKISQENKAHSELNIETKGDNTRREIKDNAIIIVSVQRQILKGHAKNLKKLNYVLKQANDTKLDQKKGKYQELGFQ